jgi:hypothetical protein
MCVCVGGSLSRSLSISLLRSLSLSMCTNTRFVFTTILDLSSVWPWKGLEACVSHWKVGMLSFHQHLHQLLLAVLHADQSGWSMHVRRHNGAPSVAIRLHAASTVLSTAALSPCKSNLPVLQPWMEEWGADCIFLLKGDLVIELPTDVDN